MDITAFIILYLLIFMNGYSDAPNAVASGIASGGISRRRALRLAAACDFCGVLLFSILRPAVAYTCRDIAVFSGDIRKGVAAGMLAALLWAFFASRFGIPTSESYAMASAVSGAAYFSGGRIEGEAWRRIWIGFFLFSAVAFLAAPLISRILAVLLPMKRGNRMLTKCQVLFCGLSSFMHGAQDGQKFIGMMMLFLGADEAGLLRILSCGVVLSFGTLFCSERIIRQTAYENVSLTLAESVASDTSSVLLMLIATLTGIPVSTSNVKNSAMLGAQAFSGRSFGAKGGLALVLVWLLTFPVCFILGGGVFALFLMI